MRIVLFGLGLLLGCRAEEAVPAEPTATTAWDPMKIAFVSHCRYSNGTHILLAHKFDTDSYRFIISNGGNNDLSTIKRGSNGSVEIETNGGVGKIVADESLMDWVLKQTFRAIPESMFTTELSRTDVTLCPGRYPFSP